MCGHLVCELFDEDPRVRFTGLVVGPPPAPSALLRSLNLRGREGHGARVDCEGDGAIERAFEDVSHGVRGDGPPDRRAFDTRGLRGVGPRRLDAGKQPGHRRRNDVGLAEARKDLVDVPQEHGGGAHDENARTGKPFALGVKKVGGAVERDGRLARARPSLDDEYSVRIGPNDSILLGLNRGDDVAHLPVAGRRHRRHQGAFTGEVEVGQPLGGFGVEQFVLHADDVAHPRLNVPAANDFAGLGRGGPVKGLGLRGPPVEENDLLVLVLEADAPDVLRFAVCEVEAPHDQAILDVAQTYEIVLVMGREGVALGEGACAFVALLRSNFAQTFGVGLALAVERGIRRLDEVLLVGDCARTRG